jgi:hypothetical protein
MAALKDWDSKVRNAAVDALAATIRLFHKPGLSG